MTGSVTGTESLANLSYMKGRLAPLRCLWLRRKGPDRTAADAVLNTTHPAPLV
jgi:hypothetical protein